MEESESRGSRTWWGDFEVEAGSVRRWRLGPATVWVERRLGEWVVAHRSEGDPFSQELEIAAPATPAEYSALPTPPQRFAGLSPGERIELQPRLADRDVVSRPEDPFSVLPGDEVLAYVGSPVWLALSLQPGTRSLVEFPLVRPSDTWFGPNTRVGELCYASRTRCRLRFEDVRWNAHRAVTEVKIRNPGREPLRIERINVPVPALTLWVHATGTLRTSSLVFTRKDDDDELAEVEIAPGGPPDARRLAEPRVPSPTGLVRAFSQLI